MPFSAIGEFFLRPVFELLFQLLGYFTGRIIVPMFTLGFVRVESIVQKRNSKSKQKNIPSITNRAHMISTDAGAFFGILFWALLVIVGYFIYQSHIG